jgi:hypothetical protein
VGTCTRTVLVTSSDPCGVKMCITAVTDSNCALDGGDDDEAYDHFSLSAARRFLDSHKGRQSIGVLGFEVEPGELVGILERYKKLHPKLLIRDDVSTYVDRRCIGKGGSSTRSIEMGRMSVLEVTCICMYVCIHACMHACMYVYICIYICVCVYIYVYMYTYIHIHIYIMCIYVMCVCVCVFVCVCVLYNM